MKKAPLKGFNLFGHFFQTQNSVYEIVSDMSSRQDTLEERLSSLEDKLSAIQEQVEYLPDMFSR